MAKAKKTVMTGRSLEALERATRNAKRRGQSIKVKGHDRIVWPRHTSRTLRKLTSWRNAETALYRLCSCLDRNGLDSWDKAAIDRAIELLTNTRDLKKP